MSNLTTQNKVPGDMGSSINSSYNLLENLGVAKQRMVYKGNTSKETTDVSKKSRYKDTYDSAVAHLDYDILLEDDSIFHFTFDPTDEDRYVFMQSPYKFSSFGDFLLDTFDPIDIPEEANNIERLRNSYAYEYEQWLNELGMNHHAVYIRYDIDIKRYMPHVHSYTHMHIGMGNGISIPSSCLLTPLSFTIFVLRHVYKDLWEKAIVADKECVLRMAEKRKPLDTKYWDKEESRELHLK